MIGKKTTLGKVKLGRGLIALRTLELEGTLGVCEREVFWDSLAI